MSQSPALPGNGLTHADLEAAILKARRFGLRFCSKHPTTDKANVVSWCQEGALTAWQDWQAARGRSWPNYLLCTLRYYSLKALRDSVPRGEQRFLQNHSVISLTVDDAEDAVPVSEPEDLDAAAALRRTELDTLLAQLNPTDRWILQERFYNDRSYEEIAKQVGMFRAQVRRVEQKALGRLRQVAGVS
jgi:RNA polymerase sigma factor (sigma-70 family)